MIKIGLDAAGKTTMLYKLKLGEVVTVIPTIGKSMSLITESAIMTPLITVDIINLSLLIFVSCF